MAPVGPQQAATVGLLGGLPALRHLDLECVPAHQLRNLPSIPSLRVLVLTVSRGTLTLDPEIEIENEIMTPGRSPGVIEEAAQ